MTNSYEIIKWNETCGDKFFTVAITNEDGTHTDKFSAALLMNFAMKMARKNKSFTVAEDEELQHELSELAFIEVSEDEESDTGKKVFDVYLHRFFIDGDNELSYDGAGEFLKTYKTEKAAMNFAGKQRHPVL